MTPAASMEACNVCTQACVQSGNVHVYMKYFDDLHARVPSVMLSHEILLGYFGPGVLDF